MTTRNTAVRTTRLAFFVCLGASALLLAQTRPSGPADSREVARGFKLRPNGVIDIGDIFAEVNFYDSNWTIAQQHDRFERESDPLSEFIGHSSTIAGTLTTAAGPAKYSEKLTAVEGGIDYSATLSSEKGLATNELSMAFLLPTKSFAGKEITIDGEPLKLAVEPAAKGQPRLSEKAEAHEITLPTATGTLTLKGTFRFMIQDDREWGDPRYSMRLLFTPGSGAIKTSKIDLQMRLAAK